MNQKIGWVGDFVALNFLRTFSPCFEEFCLKIDFEKRRVLKDLLITDGALFRIVCEASMLNDSLTGILPSNCPIDSSLMADSRQLRQQALIIYVGLHLEKKSCDLEQRNYVPHANVVKHSREFNCRLEINF